MAGKDIYLGNIMAQLKSDVMDYSAALASVVTELENVRRAVEQSTTSLNVAPSDVLRFSANNPQKRMPISGIEIKEINMYAIKVMCTGVIHLNCAAFSEYSLYESAITVSTSSGAYVNSGTGIPASIPQDFTLAVPVISGDIVTIKAKGRTNAPASTIYVNLVANSVKVYYSQIDIVNSGAVVAIG